MLPGFVDIDINLKITIVCRKFLSLWFLDDEKAFFFLSFVNIYLIN